MLEVSALSVSYGAHRALEDVSIRIEKGEICVILGANGAGKSTLLKAIAGLVRAQKGSVAIAGKAIANAPPDRIVEAGLALVPEGRGIFGDLSVAENLSLGAFGRQARAGETQRLAQVMRLFPRLDERRNQITRTMSGGEQQMVAISRALMSNPAILMLDEPSLGLSPLLTRELFRSLKAVRETGVGILMVEQNARQSLAIADRGYLLENGRITGEGRASSLVSDPAVQAAYLGGAASAAPKSLTGIATKTAVGDASGSAAQLAAHAARIQREFIAARRGGRAGSAYVNGHSSALGAGSSKGEPIVMNRQAHELSEMAADYAARAASIQRHHIESMRQPVYSARAKAAAPAAPGHDGDTPEKMAARAAAIHAAHVAASRALPEKNHKAHAMDSARKAGEMTKSQKKTLKQARKAARRAKKLADKVLRAIG